jgi:hypothetical protein
MFAKRWRWVVAAVLFVLFAGVLRADTIFSNLSTPSGLALGVQGSGISPGPDSIAMQFTPGANYTT